MSLAFNRRSFLRGMLGGAAVCVGIPVLDVFLNGNGTAFADGAKLPVRFGTYFWGLGLTDTPTGGTRWVPEDRRRGLRDHAGAANRSRRSRTRCRCSPASA